MGQEQRLDSPTGIHKAYHLLSMHHTIPAVLLRSYILVFLNVLVVWILTVGLCVKQGVETRGRRDG